jgi:general secretion pathway protein K
MTKLRHKHAQTRRTQRKRGRPRRVARASGRRGYALLLSLIAITILSVLVSDLHETSTMGLSAAMAQRDQLRAELLGKSGIHLTRMLIAQEQNLRKLAEVPYGMLFKGRKPPPIPVWQYANMILRPFSDYDGAASSFSMSGFDMSGVQGLGKTGGTFEVIGVAENSKINVGSPVYGDPSQARGQVATQLYSLTGGYQPSPNKLDPLFSAMDERNRITTRLDIVSAVIDWWDPDEQRTQFDPAQALATSAGGEDTDYYRSLPDPYPIKNAPFDSIDELRMVRGFGDDFWATFVEPDPDDPRTRQVTVYGGGKVNPNEAEPAVLLARTCSFQVLRTQLLCADPASQQKFIMLLQMARSMAPIPWFGRASDYVDFITGAPDSLYDRLKGFLTMANMGEAFLFPPLLLTEADKQTRSDLRRTFTTRASIVSLYATGKVGQAEKRIHAVINTDKRWVPPPPNVGKLPPLGVFHYYRID